MFKRYFCLSILCITLTGCFSEEDVSIARFAGRQEAKDELVSEIEDALSSCEMYIPGVLMDDGCLEDEFYYGGDFWNCEYSKPGETLVDADCVRGELGL